MSTPWPNYKLREIAEIRISNVDKKYYSSELPVRLCNYMDVYSNEYVTAEIDFMEASATQAEIERFGLKTGDVVITKDSETPDDIGIPTVIKGDIPDLVCGYHLALIRPNMEHLDPVFLAKQLSSPPVARYFSLQASGSTRYGLPISAIELALIPTPPKPEQSKIAEVLSTVDRAIAQTESLIAKQQRIKTGLIQDLLTRGIDEHGNLRSEKTHEFKDSPLGRIPVEWNVIPVHLLCIAVIDCKNRTPPVHNHGHPVIRTPNVRNGRFVYEDLNFTDAKSFKVWTQRGKPRVADVVITREAPFGEACLIPQDMQDACLGQRMMMYQVDPIVLDNHYLVYAIYSERVQKKLFEIAGGSTVGHIKVDDIRNLQIQYPQNIEEQSNISNVLNGIENNLEQQRKVLAKLHSLKTALMQDLLTGKIRVTPLLKKMETHI